MSQLLLLELADLAVNSGTPQLSWAAVESLHNQAVLFQEPSSVVSVKYSIDKQSSCTVISFVTLPIFAEEEHLLQGGGAELVSSEDSNAENFPHFDFLRSRNNPSISISRYAVDLFKTHYQELSELKSKIYDSQTARLSVDTPLIIAGHSLGGSIASLFTLWLLDNINKVPQKKNEIEPPRLPHCITFGSYLLGDKRLQGAISERPGWNSCFLHVVGNEDPLPRHFFCCHQAVQYKPFGIFFLCSESGRTCVEDPEAVSELLRSTSSQTCNWKSRIEYYRHLMDHMKSGLLIRGSSQLGSSVTSPGLVLQLEAFGIVVSQHQNIDIGTLGKHLEKLELDLERKRELDRRKAMEKSKKLNDIKKKMAHLEWYKKVCATRSIGYYDSYKNQSSTRDMDVTRLKKALTNYWKTIVGDVERMPQKQPARIRGAWLFAGMNYRRMVEPLDIAKYYKENPKGDYLRNRSKHYILLEKWQLDESERPPGSPNETKKRNVANLLTEDSCFWARVEKALLACELLRGDDTSTGERESSTEYLSDFEEYVMDQIDKYAVSPEIFFADCSFMRWWRQFQEIIALSHDSPLVQFMRNDGPELYKKGMF